MRTRGDLPEMEGFQVPAGGSSEVHQMQQRGTLVIPACFHLKSVFNGSQITRRVPGISSLVKFARLSLAEELRSQMAWDYICHIRGWVSTRRFGYTSQNPREQSEDAGSVQTEITHWEKLSSVCCTMQNDDVCCSRLNSHIKNKWGKVTLIISEV